MSRLDGPCSTTDRYPFLIVDDYHPCREMSTTSSPVRVPDPGGAPFLPRLAERRLAAVGAAMPAVVVMGPRQVGKSTLARVHATAAGHRYLTLDDAGVREQARTDPITLLRSAPRLILDEVQREPALLLALKQVIDEDAFAGIRDPGRFIVTGSADLLGMASVADSLAGRAAYVTLRPMTRREQLGRGTAGRWSAYLDTPRAEWLDVTRADDAPAASWTTVARRGGFPVPALDLRDDDARVTWYRGWLDTFLDRDVRHLGSVGDALELRRLMRVLALRQGQLVNRADLARDAAVSPTTAWRWLALLERGFQFVRLDAYAVDRTKRLIKAPKAYWCDPALANVVAGAPPLDGAALEGLVLTDLLAWADADARGAQVLHWRTASQQEVDFVIERADGRLLGVECKATTRPGTKDAAGLRAFLGEYPEAVGGLVLHGGEQVQWLADGVLAVPWWRVC